MSDIYGLPPGTADHKEGDTWTTMVDGRPVTNTIPFGNGNNTVDQVITNPDGSTTNSRVVANGQGGWQRWNNDSTGTASYADKDTETSEVYGQHFNAGQSTTAAPSHDFGISPDYQKTYTASYDSDGNRVGTDVGIANQRYQGIYNNTHVDNFGNETYTHAKPDGHGGVISSFAGQVDNQGQGTWQDMNDKWWTVSTDISGKPVRYRTERVADGVHQYYVNGDGVETDKFTPDKKGNLGEYGLGTQYGHHDPGRETYYVDTYNLDGSVTRRGSDGSQITIRPDGTITGRHDAPDHRDIVQRWWDKTTDAFDSNWKGPAALLGAGGDGAPGVGQAWAGFGKQLGVAGLEALIPGGGAALANSGLVPGLKPGEASEMQKDQFKALTGWNDFAHGDIAGGIGTITGNIAGLVVVGAATDGAADIISPVLRASIAGTRAAWTEGTLARLGTGLDGAGADIPPWIAREPSDVLTDESGLGTSSPTRGGLNDYPNQPGNGVGTSPRTPLPRPGGGARSRPGDNRPSPSRPPTGRPTVRKPWVSADNADPGVQAGALVGPDSLTGGMSPDEDINPRTGARPQQNAYRAPSGAAGRAAGEEPWEATASGLGELVNPHGRAGIDSSVEEMPADPNRSPGSTGNVPPRKPPNDGNSNGLSDGDGEPDEPYDGDESQENGRPDLPPTMYLNSRNRVVWRKTDSAAERYANTTVPRDQVPPDYLIDPKPRRYTGDLLRQLSDKVAELTPMEDTPGVSRIGSADKPAPLPTADNFTSNARGFAGEALERARLRRAEYPIVSEQTPIGVPVNGKFVYIRTDFLAIDPATKELVITDPKFGQGAGYTDSEIDAYRVLAGGKLTTDDLDLSKATVKDENGNVISLTERLGQLAESNKLRSNRISRVETVPWVRDLLPDSLDPQIVKDAAHDFEEDYYNNYPTRRGEGMGRSAQQAKAFLDEWASDPNFPDTWNTFKPPPPKNMPSSTTATGPSPRGESATTTLPVLIPPGLSGLTNIPGGSDRTNRDPSSTVRSALPAGANLQQPATVVPAQLAKIPPLPRTGIPLTRRKRIDQSLTVTIISTRSISFDREARRVYALGG